MSQSHDPRGNGADLATIHMDDGEGDLVLYDPENHQAWVQSSVSIEATAVRSMRLQAFGREAENRRSTGGEH